MNYEKKIKLGEIKLQNYSNFEHVFFFRLDFIRLSDRGRNHPNGWFSFLPHIYYLYMIFNNNYNENLVERMCVCVTRDFFVELGFFLCRPGSSGDRIFFWLGRL